MHTVKTVKIVVVVVFVVVFFPCKDQTKRHDVGGQFSVTSEFLWITASYTKSKALLGIRTSHPHYLQSTLGTCCPLLFLFLNGWSNQELSEN